MDISIHSPLDELHPLTYEKYYQYSGLNRQQLGLCKNMELYRKWRNGC